MTCIVGIEAQELGNPCIVMGADRICYGWEESYDSTESKIVNFVLGQTNIFVGYTSSFRFGQIIKYHFIPPRPKEELRREMELLRYLHKDFVPALRRTLEQQNFSEIKDNVSDSDSTALIGIAGRIFCLQHDYSILRSTRGYYSIGSGAPYANAICEYKIGSGNEKPTLGQAKITAKDAIKIASKITHKVSSNIDVHAI